MTSLLHQETREGIQERLPKHRQLKRDAAGRYWTTELAWTRERCSPASRERPVPATAQSGPLEGMFEISSTRIISRGQLISSAVVIGAILASAIYLVYSYLI
jgi:hypothetical protein